MFHSGVYADDLINEIKGEVDVFPTVPDSTYLRWLNETEQFLYANVIREQKRYVPSLVGYHLDASSCLSIDLSSRFGALDEANMRFEDIHAVFILKSYGSPPVQLIHTSPANGTVFPDTYFKKNDALVIHTTGMPAVVYMVVFVRPAIKQMTAATVPQLPHTEVMLPPEWLSLIKTKLRGEAYKLMNEDGMAAKWINDYNAYLEDFSAWIAYCAPSFGV